MPWGAFLAIWSNWAKCPKCGAIITADAGQLGCFICRGDDDDRGRRPPKPLPPYVPPPADGPTIRDFQREVIEDGAIVTDKT